MSTGDFITSRNYHERQQHTAVGCWAGIGSYADDLAQQHAGSRSSTRRCKPRGQAEGEKRRLDAAMASAATLEELEQLLQFGSGMHVLQTAASPADHDIAAYSAAGVQRASLSVSSAQDSAGVPSSCMPRRCCDG